MGRLSISVSRENRPVIVKRKWPSSPKILIFVLVPLILMAILWYIVITARSKRVSRVNVTTTESIKDVLVTEKSIQSTVQEPIVDVYELQFMVNHHLHTNFTKEKNQIFEDSFCFIQLFSPCHEILYKIGKGGQRTTWKVIEKIKLLEPQPKFMMIDVPIKSTEWDDDYYKTVTTGFVKLVSTIKVPLILVPGQSPSTSSLTEANGNEINEIIKNYRESFGEDHFEFFINGVKLIVTNPIYDVISDNLNELQPAVFEYESWLSVSLEESRSSSANYQHVIVLRSSLDNFDDFKRKSGSNDSLISRDKNHLISQRFLDKLVTYNVNNVITFQGKVNQCTADETKVADDETDENEKELKADESEKDEKVSMKEADDEKEPKEGKEEKERKAEEKEEKERKAKEPKEKADDVVVHKKDHHEAVGYYRGTSIILSDNLNHDDYRIIWIFRDGIHDQVYDVNN